LLAWISWTLLITLWRWSPEGPGYLAAKLVGVLVLIPPSVIVGVATVLASKHLIDRVTR
jgi:hypothetical protein